MTQLTYINTKSGAQVLLCDTNPLLCKLGWTEKTRQIPKHTLMDTRRDDPFSLLVQEQLLLHSWHKLPCKTIIVLIIINNAQLIAH